MIYILKNRQGCSFIRKPRNYLATQRDPFAAQFDLLRRTLCTGVENVLATCGYGFGDEHINQEIELALQHPENKTTILAFVQSLNPTIKSGEHCLGLSAFMSLPAMDYTLAMTVLFPRHQMVKSWSGGRLVA